MKVHDTCPRAARTNWSGDGVTLEIHMAAEKRPRTMCIEAHEKVIFLWQKGRFLAVLRALKAA
jgi:hypothetical protein